MIEELSKICKTIENVDLKKYNTFRLSSEAYAMCFPYDVSELVSIIEVLKKYKIKYFVIGNGSNIILPEYYDGVIIKLKNFNKCIVNNDSVYVESGCMINKLALDLAEQGYAGLDFACGIPGTVGGCIYGNAGCYGSSISEVLTSVTVLDGKNIKELTNEEMKFNYRTSILKEENSNLIILSANFKIHKTIKDELKELIKERAEKRATSQDLNHPSNGSMFRNPEGMIAGKMIDDAGMKGLSVGDAMVSHKHANFIINTGNATSDDIISLIKKIRKEIKKIYKVDLILEQEIIK